MDSAILRLCTEILNNAERERGDAADLDASRTVCGHEPELAALRAEVARLRGVVEAATIHLRATELACYDGVGMSATWKVLDTALTAMEEG
jgi:hypothetical protein